MRLSTLETKDGVSTKWCNRCKKRKHIDDFNVDNNRIDGMKGWCALCDKGYAREYKLSKIYKMTVEQYEERYRKQGGVCAICGTIPVTNPKIKSANHVLHVDHDHIKKKSRGLLCYKCNHGIGNFNDSIELLIKAAEYLLEWQ